MSQTKAKRVPESTIPEVANFIEVQKKVARLRDAYPEVFEQLDSLKEEYNAALEAAEKRCRADQVSCGPFDLYQFQTKYDAEKLLEEVGRDEFLKVGGTIKTITQYDVDAKKLEAHITSGTIPKEVVDHVKAVSPRFKKPEKIGGV